MHKIFVVGGRRGGLDGKTQVLPATMVNQEDKLSASARGWN